MTADAQDGGKGISSGTPEDEAFAISGLDKIDTRGRSLFCVAVGREPAGREHRMEIREDGTSFAMIDSRRRCQVRAHWACRLTEEDTAKEVAFVFRVKVKTFKYPEAAGAAPAPWGRARKAKCWKT